jgi:hypothetical protein
MVTFRLNSYLPQSQQFITFCDIYTVFVCACVYENNVKLADAIIRRKVP